MHLKVISVDDSPVIAEHLKKMLEGIESVIFSGHAFTVSEAVDLVKNQNPAVVFLDIVLKDESGIDFLSKLKNRLPEIKVIILSNHSNLFYKNKSKEMGADYFLDKSYEFDKIPEILNKINLNL